MRTTFHVRPIGRVRSRLHDRHLAPRQDDEGAPPAVLELDPLVAAGLIGLVAGSEVLVLTWLHEADRDQLRTRPRDDPHRAEQGVFSTRSPNRPNPIGLHRVSITSIEDTALEVSGLDAIDGTPIIDIKPVLGPLPQR